ncbi:thermonuclease family protein [Microvirga sp. W0021]|uniref:Thermonuclease family protein n=1 Tax=Hohaiivirga grylli TaxID=3133970 RepID=A0ABV0BKZ0_9HYPH
MIGLILTAQSAFAATQIRNNKACFDKEITTQVVGWNKYGDLMLSSGQTVYLADVIIPQWKGRNNRRFQEISKLFGKTVIVKLQSKPDRWKRYMAAVSHNNDDIAHKLVRKGQAIVSAREKTRLCTPQLLESEKEAREGKFGLWATNSFTPIAATDIQTLKEKNGQFVLVYGTIINIGERKNWTYLNFGTNWKNDLAAMIPAGIWGKLKETGLSVNEIKGRTVLLRGTVKFSDHWGPSIEIQATELLQLDGGV